MEKLGLYKEWQYSCDFTCQIEVPLNGKFRKWSTLFRSVVMSVRIGYNNLINVNTKTRTKSAFILLFESKI